MRIFFHGVMIALVFSAQRSKKSTTSLQKSYHPLVISSTAVQIFKLQETVRVSSDAVQPEAAITDLAPTFVSSNKYTWSAWFYQTFWGVWGSYVVIALNPAYLNLFLRSIVTLKL